MLDEHKKNELKKWLKNNGVPESLHESLIEVIGTHKLLKEHNIERKELLSKLGDIKKTTEKLNDLINRLPKSSSHELENVVEDHLIRQQWDNYVQGEKLEPRHLGDISISMYLSSLQSACEALDKVKPDIKDEHIYPTLIWLCESISSDHQIELNHTKIIDFICAYTSKDNETVKKQYGRLRDKGVFTI